MGRGKKGERLKLRRTDDQIQKAIEDDLRSLQLLTDAYDKGHSGGVGPMATLVLNIVGSAHKVLSSQRALLSFPTPASEVSPDHLTPTNRCVAMQMSSGPEGHHVDYVPLASSALEAPRYQPFRVWWRTEPIYVEGIGGFSVGGAIPLRPEEQLDWESRLKLTRERFVTDLRNTMGAHRDDEIPADLAGLYRSAAFGGEPAAMSCNGELLTVENGGIEVGTWPAEAMMRHIAEEVLMAYGYRPNHGWNRNAP